MLVVLWILAAAYLLSYRLRGWIPHDEGTIAQSAERALLGELPHRDFDEGYTGAQTWLHAGAFRLLGTRLGSLRTLLYLFALAFVPALYAIARRAARPATAALVSAAALVWTVPNYFASLPSWYNLFFAVFGALAVLKHVETARIKWLFFAGICAGASIAMKIVGLYDVAAVLLFLAYREGEASRARSGRPGRGYGFAYTVTAGGAIFLFVLIRVLRSRLELMDVFHFVLPTAVVVAVVVGLEWRSPHGPFSARLTAFGRLALPFLAGVALPLLLFLVPYVATNSLASLVDGLFVRPQRQIATVRWHLPPFGTVVAAAPYALLLAFPRLAPAGRRGTAIACACLSALLVALLLTADKPDVYRAIWNSARSLGPVTVIIGSWRLARSGDRMAPARRQQLFLLMSLVALITLVQFPFSAPIYFCYAAAFIPLALLVLVSAEVRPSPLHGCVLLFYIAFAMFFLNPGYVFRLGDVPGRYRADADLDLPRGGIRVSAADSATYRELAAAVEEKGSGPYIYAGPDCPEVYFLCGKRNPSRFFFEHLSSFYGDSEGILRLLESRGVRVVVWNTSPDFSRRLQENYRAALASRFPHSRPIGKFVLMWRD